MIINPVITPSVTDDRAFATRAILGEEQWIADPIKRRDIIALNAGALLLTAGKVDSFREGAEQARDALWSGKAGRVLNAFVAASNEVATNG